MTAKHKSRAAAAAAAISLGFLLAPALYGQNGGDDVQQTVARVSYLSGAVSYARGDDPDNWQTADLNVPLTLGDRLFTSGAGRAEFQIHGGAVVRMSANTDLAAMNLTDDTKQFSQTLGVATFQIRRLGSNEVFEVDTPNAAVTFDAIGDYRVDVDNDGNSRISVRRGRAIVAAGGGQVTLNSGDEMDVNGLDAPQYDVVAVASPDGFDRWVQGRDDRANRSRSRQYVSEDVVGVADLDDYGQWQNIPDYGRVWAPASVATGWAPYRDGHWVWQDPWGWTWVSSEAWGWAPYHSGRWVTASSRWYWVPDGPRVHVAYAPALVAFVGGSPSSMGSGGGYVGWFPLAPREPFNPWWGRRGGEVSVTNVTFVNRTYVTVVNQNTFVSGGIVTRNFVTDRNVIRQIGVAPILRGPLPFVPTQASLRVAVRTGLPAPPRPPSIVLERAVVARVAPPPAPPRFEAKLAIIRENGGAPVSSEAAARIVDSRQGRPAAVTAIRPVTSEPGRMTLAPARAREGARPVASAPAAAVPIAPIRGRERATSAQPTGGPIAGQSQAQPPARVPAPPLAQPGRGDAQPGQRLEQQQQQQPAGVRPQQGDRSRPAVTAVPPSDRSGSADQQNEQRRQEAERQRLQQQQQQQQQQNDARRPPVERARPAATPVPQSPEAAAPAVPSDRSRGVQQQQQQQQQQNDARRQDAERQRLDQQKQQDAERQRLEQQKQKQQQQPQQQQQQQQQQQTDARRQEQERQRPTQPPGQSAQPAQPAQPVKPQAEKPAGQNPPPPGVEGRGRPQENPKTAKTPEKPKDNKDKKDEKKDEKKD